MWPAIYASLFVLSAVVGAFGLGAPPGGGWRLVCFSFVALLIFPSAAIKYASTRTEGPFPRASFTRGFTGGWWTDPWQSLRVSALLVAGWVLGRAFTLPHARAQDLMQFWTQLSGLVGFLLGVGAAHILFRSRIA
jgi:hypothetical protein